MPPSTHSVLNKLTFTMHCKQTTASSSTKTSEPHSPPIVYLPLFDYCAIPEVLPTVFALRAFFFFSFYLHLIYKFFLSTLHPSPLPSDCFKLRHLNDRDDVPAQADEKNANLVRALQRMHAKLAIRRSHVGLDPPRAGVHVCDRVQRELGDKQAPAAEGCG